MTAAFQGTYSDWKLIRSRSVVQIVVEIPLEAAGHAYDVLGGMPQPGAEIPVAVARLQPVAEPTGSPSAPGTSGQAGAPVQASPRAIKPVKQAWSEMKLVTRAGIICNDPAFWEWTAKRFLHTDHIVTPEEAAVWLRHRTAVTSRKEYDTDPKAAQRYLSVEKEFLAHKNDAARYGT